MTEVALKESSVLVANHMLGQFTPSGKEASAHGARDFLGHLVLHRMHGQRVFAQSFDSLQHLATQLARRRLRAMHHVHVVLHGVLCLAGVEAARARTLKGLAQIVRLQVAGQRKSVDKRQAAHRAKERTRPIGVVRLHVRLQVACCSEETRAHAALVLRRKLLCEHRGSVT